MKRQKIKYRVLIFMLTPRAIEIRKTKIAKISGTLCVLFTSAFFLDSRSSLSASCSVSLRQMEKIEQSVRSSDRDGVEYFRYSIEISNRTSPIVAGKIEDSKEISLNMPSGSQPSGAGKEKSPSIEYSDNNRNSFTSKYNYRSQLSRIEQAAEKSPDGMVYPAGCVSPVH